MSRIREDPRMRARWPSLPERFSRCAQHAGSRLYGCYAWIVFTILVLSFGGLALLAGRKDRARRMARFFARLMFRLGGISLFAAGLDRLPDRPHILLVNHTSHLDALVLSALLPASPGYTFTTRRQFFLQGMLWPLVGSVGAIVLKHRDKAEHSGNVERLESALERGENLVIFPEGEFGPEPGLKPFHSGAFVAAAQADVPVVVAGLRGARHVLRLGTWLPKKGPVSLEIGPALRPCGNDAQTIHRFMAAAHATMLPLSGESSRDG